MLFELNWNPNLTRLSWRIFPATYEFCVGTSRSGSNRSIWMEEDTISLYNLTSSINQSISGKMCLLWPFTQTLDISVPASFCRAGTTYYTILLFTYTYIKRIFEASGKQGYVKQQKIESWLAMTDRDDSRQQERESSAVNQLLSRKDDWLTASGHKWQTPLPELFWLLSSSFLV